MGFLFPVASEVYFEEAEGNKKQQAPACYGFHACPGLPSGMHEVNPFGKETKNNKRQLVMVFMLAQDCPLGCTK
jgi:hypothetical protein